MDIKLRPSGIEGVGDMTWGTHFCLFYETKEDLLDVLIPYFKAGLENDEFFLCVASPPLSTEEAQRAMQEAVPDFKRYLADGQIEIVPYRDWLLTGGRLDAQRVLQNWIAKLNWALAKGYAGLRFAGDPSWLDKEAWGDVSEFEKQLDQIVGKSQMLGLCAYDLERCSAADVLDVVHHHQFTVAKRKGAWEHLEASELKRAHDEIRQLNADLERRVLERTSQLAAANEQLRQEVSERKQAEALLHAREQEFRVIVENAPDQIIRYDKEFRRTYVNPAVSAAYGLPKEAFIGKPVGSVVEDAGLEPDIDALTAIRRQIKSVFDTGESTEYEVTFPSPGGRRTYWTRMYPEFDPNGVVIHVLSISREITDRKQADEALRRSESNFRTLADKSLQGIAIGQGLNIVYVNSAHATIYGYTIEELKSMSPEQLLGLVHPDDRAIAGERARKRMAGEELPPSVELRIVRKDGSTRWIQVFNNPIEYSGQPTILSMSIDITERKQAEEAIRKSEQVLREAESLGHTGSWEQDLITGEIFNTEENWRLFFGADPSKRAPFDDYAQAVHPDDHEYVLRRRAELLEEEGPSDIEYSVIWPDGSIHVIFGRATVVRNELGQAIRVYGTNVDITERKRAEEETKHQAARAETLARIAARLNKHLDLEAVIHAVCEEAINIFKVSQATMSLYDKKRDLLVYAGGVNIPPEYDAIMEPITRSRFDDFLQAMGPIMVIPDIQSLPDVPNAEFSSHLDVRTVVTVAMLRDQELVGVLAVGVNGHIREFDKDELTLLKAISDQAAQAIANALLLKAANEQHEQLRALSTKLVEAQETERRALTTELHDRVGQNLTGLSINLQNMKALLSDETAKPLTTKFDDAQALVEHTTRQIRDIMAELHPPELEDYGLAVALETYAERAASRGNLELNADLPDLSPPSLPSDVSIALFRAAQEAISNVLKHADATQLEVSLEKSDGRIRLRVEDDGKGFEPDAASQKEAQTWGLKIMRERIESIGGKVQIESEPGEGTRVVFEIEGPS